MKPYWSASKTPSLVLGSALLFKTPIKRDLKWSRTSTTDTIKARVERTRLSARQILRGRAGVQVSDGFIGFDHM